MQFRIHKIIRIIVNFTLIISTSIYSQEINNQVTINSKPHIIWWWPSYSVEITEIDRQLEMFDSVGIGGVHIKHNGDNRKNESEDFKIYSNRCWH